MAGRHGQWFEYDWPLDGAMARFGADMALIDADRAARPLLMYVSCQSRSEKRETLSTIERSIASGVKDKLIKKLGALAFLSGREISMELARSCISELLGGEEPVSVTVDKIFAAVYRKDGIPKEELTGNRRTREIAQARHIAIYLIRKITEMSLPNIGKIFGRDHTTILSSCETVEKKLHSDAVLAMDIDTMIKEVTGDEKLK